MPLNKKPHTFIPMDFAGALDQSRLPPHRLFFESVKERYHHGEFRGPHEGTIMQLLQTIEEHGMASGRYERYNRDMERVVKLTEKAEKEIYRVGNELKALKKLSRKRSLLPSARAVAVR